jgi:hypothetical protein
MSKRLMDADITPEQASRWPKSRAFVICAAVVYESPEGLRATFWKDEQEANELAVAHQRQGQRAWMVMLEGDGLLVHAN